jgi:hypothetical protein
MAKNGVRLSKDYADLHRFFAMEILSSICAATNAKQRPGFQICVICGAFIPALRLSGDIVEAGESSALQAD